MFVLNIVIDGTLKGKSKIIYLILKSLKPMFWAIVQTVGDVVAVNELLNVYNYHIALSIIKLYPDLYLY